MRQRMGLNVIVLLAFDFLGLDPLLLFLFLFLLFFLFFLFFLLLVIILAVRPLRSPLNL